MDARITRTRLVDDPAGERFVSLRRTLGITSFGMNQMFMEPGQQGRIHLHTRQEEVYLVLEGTLDLELEGETLELGAGELVRVPGEVRRRIGNRGPGRLVMIALGGDGEHQGRDAEAFPDWDATAPVAPRDLPLPVDLPPDALRS